MATQRVVLTIEMLPEEAKLLESVARLRLKALSPDARVDLGDYIRQVLDQDVKAMEREIKARRGG